MIRTDLQLVTKGAIAAATGTLTYYKNLNDFDAVVWFASGEPALTVQQKQDLLSFVRDGKGLVVIHSGLATSRAWLPMRSPGSGSPMCRRAKACSPS